jgi:predicted alpha/beta-hydrolase family hydrolase
VVQGGRDPFGRPEEFPEEFREKLPPGSELVTVPYGDHGFAVPKSADITQQEALTLLTDAVTAWLAGCPVPRE